MVKIICMSCRKEVEVNVSKGKSGDRNVITCSNCGRVLPSSKKVPTGNLIGRLHAHEEYKMGDRA